jgi:PAS domain S-box-containing protein
MAAERREAAKAAGLRRVCAFIVSAESEEAVAVELFDADEDALGPDMVQDIHFLRMQLNRLASRDRAKAAVRKAALHCRRLGTQLQTTAARLREVEERYSLICRSSHEGVWDWDLKQDRVFYSPRWKSLLGIGARELGDQPAEWLDRIHPEDRSRVDKELEEHLEWHSDIFESRHRIRHQDGSYLQVAVRAMAVQDEAGEPYRLCGSLAAVEDAAASMSAEMLHNPATGIPTCALMLDRLQQVMERRSRTPDRAYAVLSIGLEELKSHVHAGPEEIADMQRVLARRAALLLRPGDTFAHAGDAEFGVILDEIQGLNDAQRITDRLRSALQQPVSLNGYDVKLTTRTGIVLGRISYDRPEDVLQDAMLAMRRAERLEEAEHVYDAATSLFVQSVSELERDLLEAFERRQLYLEYQPIVALDDGRITGMEAFIRWKHPDKGQIPPSQLLMVAEEAGLMEEMNYWILGRACRQLKEWHSRASVRFPPVVAVNIPERQFFGDDFVGRTLSTIETTELEPRFVRLDVEEETLARDPNGAARILEILSEHRIQVAIDDFGTGYSSLSHLHRMSVSTLKIDRAFVSGTTGMKHEWDVARTIVQLAENLDLDVIAEGIETHEQFQHLRKLGCKQAQGYFFSEPVGADQAARLVREGYPLDLKAPTR